MKKFVFKGTPVRCAVLMSGSGSNARALLDYERTRDSCPYHVAAVVTDAPETSLAEEIARTYGVPFAGCDIRRFYAAHGENSIKLDTPRRRELREEWSGELFRTLGPFAPEFALFAGFMPLTNLASRLPCLNVHPGDLTRRDAAGRRIYAGFHVLPVEEAILNGEHFLRSSVILVQPYSGDGGREMDEGPVLGISAPLPVDTGGVSPEELRRIRDSRVRGVPCDDLLRRLALAHIERLKLAGDHVVFPRAAADFAAGAFGCDGGDLYYFGRKVTGVVYAGDAPPAPFGGSSN